MLPDRPRRASSTCASTPCCIASVGLTYSFEKIQGLKIDAGRRFGHVPGPLRRPGGTGPARPARVRQRPAARRWRRARAIQVEPGGFLYKDAAVTMEIANPSSTGGRWRRWRRRRAGGQGPGQPGLRRAQGGAGGDEVAGDKIGGLMSGLQAATPRRAPAPSMTLMRLAGPGRVGIQSMYKVHNTD